MPTQTFTGAEETTAKYVDSICRIKLSTKTQRAESREMRSGGVDCVSVRYVTWWNSLLASFAYLPLISGVRKSTTFNRLVVIDELDNPTTLSFRSMLPIIPDQVPFSICIPQEYCVSKWVLQVNIKLCFFHKNYLHAFVHI